MDGERGIGTVQEADQTMRSRRDWAIAGITALVVCLVGLCAYLLFGTSVGQDAMAQTARAIAELPGIQWLIGRLDVEWAPARIRTAQLLEAGVALAREGRYEEALEAYGKVIEFSPQEVEAYIGRAGVLEAMEDLERAEEELEQAIEIDPQYADAYRRLGRVQCMRGDTETCLATLERAVDLEPDNAWGRYLLGVAYQQGADSGLDKAIGQYLEALRLDPDLSIAYLGLAKLYRSQPGNEPLAVEALKKAIDAGLKGEEEELVQRARSELAQLYYVQDQYDECVEQWVKVLEVDRDDAEAHRRLGLCYAMRRETGDLERAITELESALELGFGHMDAYYFFLGQRYANQEQYARAFFAFDQFLRFSDNEEMNAQVRAWMEAYQEALEEERP
jgi:tetratricopeptide (TPR) repeat protein